MNIDKLTILLNQVQQNQITIDQAISSLRQLPFEDLGFSKIDYHRQLRQGFPEVIFCEGKTIEQVVKIAERLVDVGQPLFATRATVEMYQAVLSIAPKAIFNQAGRTISLPAEKLIQQTGILVVSAGTSDIPVAEEAVETASIMGNQVDRLYDVGVAGLHRLLSNYEQLADANVLVVVAGMEGALASVVGGLVDKPVIAVPTSIGYGASFNGLAALLTMLNSCASGVSVVNIDNGFGAGYNAALINRQIHQRVTNDENNY